jgi:acetyl-CoA carboxylase carboxyltransferase component
VSTAQAAGPGAAGSAGSVGSAAPAQPVAHGRRAASRHATDPRVADVRARLRAAHEASAAPTAQGAAKLASQNKLYVRDRVALLFDEGSFVEDGRYANAQASGLPADGVVTGRGLVDGRPAIVVANDPTVKAGSWGARTVEKIVRATEAALREELPVFWFVDSAGARITDQVQLFPGRRGAGRIFHNQVALSGKVPQICCLFGPSAAGGAYIPSFTDCVIMVEANASMYLGSPRMAEMVVGERVSLEEMGGARMHCTVSGCGDLLASDDADAIEQARLLFSYLPSTWRDSPPSYEAEPPSRTLEAGVVPEVESTPFDIHDVIDGLVDDASFFEIKPLFAAELVTGFGRMDGETVGIVANNSAVRGGVLFGDSADKAARFIWLCDAFNVPLVYLADVPGFMIGTEVERAGIIRHGAKMVTAVSEATVPQVSVVVRKAYGAGLYAMAGPGFGPDACLALPTARIAVMGPDAAVNAVYAGKIAGIEDDEERAAYVAARRAEYEEDVDLERLVSDLVLDGVVDPEDLRQEIILRLRYAARRDRRFSERRRGVPPV